MPLESPRLGFGSILSEAELDHIFINTCEEIFVQELTDVMQMTNKIPKKDQVFIEYLIDKHFVPSRRYGSERDLFVNRFHERSIDDFVLGKYLSDAAPKIRKISKELISSINLQHEYQVFLAA